MKRTFFFFIILSSFVSVSAQRSGFEAPADSSSWLIKAYTDSINAYRMRIDSLQNANAISEGINSMVQAAKRKARGYRTFKGFASMIYLVAGKLKLAVPAPF